MKTLKLFFVLILPIPFFSCNKEQNGHIKVDGYVKLLKANKYNNAQIPSFTLEDIDELLKYRNEEDIITHFPRSIISSYYQSECKLGIFILWTIESVRVGAANDKLYRTGRFPSLNPILKLRDPAEGFVIVDDEEAHQAVSEAYHTWWTQRGLTGATYNSWLNIDPLENTKYTWH